ncbi:hypothetical protein [Amycolatopsis pretoriensis]|uniref:hypothetical protein n=1 Tax=Amycolatopsis pretoriensis TaxID=218821 RepID=UPI00115F8FBB|nr:hypothetical protein [Amycolatopsis pretoriensis]
MDYDVQSFGAISRFIGDHADGDADLSQLTGRDRRYRDPRVHPKEHTVVPADDRDNYPRVGCWRRCSAKLPGPALDFEQDRDAEQEQKRRARRPDGEPSGVGVGPHEPRHQDAAK